MGMTVLTDDIVNTLCQLGAGPRTCAFLMASGKGLVCGKQDPELRNVVVQRLYKGDMNAKGDHCLGPDFLYEPITQELRG